MFAEAEHASVIMPGKNKVCPPLKIGISIFGIMGKKEQKSLPRKEFLKVPGSGRIQDMGIWAFGNILQGVPVHKKQNPFLLFSWKYAHCEGSRRLRL